MNIEKMVESEGNSIEVARLSRLFRVSFYWGYRVLGEGQYVLF